MPPGTSSPPSQPPAPSLKVPPPIDTSGGPASAPPDPDGEDDLLSNSAPLPPKSPKRAALRKQPQTSSPDHNPMSPTFSPSPGKRTDKINVAAGLSASKGSKGSHTKKKQQLHHLHPPSFPRIDFARLTQEHGGFKKARQALRHRVEDHQHVDIKKREGEFADGHLGALFDETVRLSGVSGPQPVNTPFEKMEEVMAHAKRVKAGQADEESDDVLIAVRRGWMTGQVLMPQKVGRCPLLPARCCPPPPPAAPPPNAPPLAEPIRAPRLPREHPPTAARPPLQDHARAQPAHGAALLQGAPPLVPLLLLHDRARPRRERDRRASGVLRAAGEPGAAQPRAEQAQLPP